MPSTELRWLNPADITDFALHLERHLAESPLDLFGPFHPLPEGERITLENRRAEWKRRWTLPCQGVDWQRALGAWEGDRLIGHLELKASGLLSEAHRVQIEMGIETPHRGQGLGSRILKEGLRFLREETSVETATLHVFAHNEPARRLYARYGFQLTATLPDRFRIRNRSVDDLILTQALR